MRATTLNRPLSDSAGVADARATTLNRPLSGSVSVTDASVTDVSSNIQGKILSDNAGFTDVDTKATDKSTSSVMGLTDEINSVIVLKNTSEPLAVSDVFDAATAKARSDVASLADAGVVRSHGYVDFSYFLEDYVGTSRSF